MDIIASRFAEALALDPHAIAIDSATKQVSYERLAVSAAQLGQELDTLERTLGPQTSRLVAVLAEHSADAVTAIFGTVLSGWSYTPLDPHASESELAHMLKASGASVLIADRSNITRAQTVADGALPVLMLEGVLEGAAEQKDAPDHKGASTEMDAPAYTLFTSGSSGQPKPVCHSRASLIRSVDCYTADSDLCPEDRVSLVTPLGFTPSVFCLFGALLSGARLCVFDASQHQGRALRDWVAAQDLTLLYTTPTLFRRWAGALPDYHDAMPGAPVSLRMIQLAGEPLLASDVALFQRKFSPSVRLYNGMGTTETSCAARFMIDHTMTFANGSVPIGFPYADTDLIIRNGAGRILGAGEIGTLHIRSKWTNEPDAEFNTGDMAMADEGGRLSHFGRAEDRVQIDGVHVDLLEIESLLMQTPAVSEAVAIPVDDEAGPALAAFVSLSGVAMRIEELRDVLARELPAQMVPTYWSALEALSILSAGKIDRLALRALVSETAIRFDPVPYTADKMDAYVLDTVRRILGEPYLAPNADFFASGGDVRSGLELVMAVERDLGIGLSLSRLARASTPINLAHQLRRQKAGGDMDGVPVNDLAAVWQLDHSAPLTMTPISTNLPSAARALLDHQDSMTATLATWSGQAVSLNVLAQRQLGRYFMRKIELVCAPARTLAIAGIRIDLTAFSPPIRLEIMAGDIPFGRILNTHNITTQHDPQGFFVTDDGRYGRTNRIKDEAGTVLADVIEVLSVDEPPAR